jgi:UMF1 family MFS transporter
VCLAIALVGFVQPEIPWFGLSKEDAFNIRATNLLVAAWFLVFSLPLFLFVPEQRIGRVRIDLGGAFDELRRTFHAIGRYREMVKFLAARLVFNDGLVTIFAFGGIYAAGTFGMTLAEIILFGIVLNVAAGLGAVGFGFLDDMIGGKRTILLTLVALSVATALAVWAPNRTWLWVAGVLIGLFAGPNQSASRSLMGRFVPDARQAEFFGFYGFSGRITSFAGPLLLGAATAALSSQRAGVATLLLFFIAGGLLMTSVDEARGIAAAKEP